jgi:glycerophosphoryl diester phosphodiesterase
MKAYLYFFFLLIFSFTTCKKAEFDAIDNLNNGKINVIGHGGGGFQSLIQPLPSNSFTNIKNAIDGLNADGIEIDLKVTSDSTVILFHDDILETSTNCSGCPENFSSFDIINCKFKNYYGSRAFNEENLISLQQLVDYFKGRNDLPHIFASPKITNICTGNDPLVKEKYVKAVSKIIKDNNAYSWISVYDGDVDFLEMFRAIDPQIDLIYNAQEFDEAINIVNSHNFSGIVIGLDDITKEQVKIAHNNNKTITVWEVILKRDVLEAIEKNTDAIMTDNIPLTLEVLRKK